MIETDKVLWNQLFQDKPIPQTALDDLRTQLMAQIVSKPVDFAEEMLLAKRRNWGLWLVISLVVTGLAMGVFVWLERDLVFQGLQLLGTLVSELPYVAYLLQIGHRIVLELLIFRELSTGLALLWGVVSWPIFGVMTAIVIFRSANHQSLGKPSI